MKVTVQKVVAVLPLILFELGCPACTLQQEPADALADAVVVAAEALQKGADPQTVVRVSVDRPQPATIVLLPNAEVDEDVLRRHEVDDVNISLLRHLHNQRKPSGTTLAVLTENQWSSVDYLGDSIELDDAFVVSKQPHENVEVTLVKGTHLPRLTNLR